MTADMPAEPLNRHRHAIDRLGASVLDGPGAVASETRHAAAARGEVPEPYAAYVDAIHDHAYRITDRRVAELHAAGASDDEVFEVTVAAAYGAA
ncbi:MAG TPA: hypothetical protein VIC58_11940, partial [Actinomycetota bacterium]